MLVFKSLNNLLYDAYIISQKGVDNFEIEHNFLFFGFWLGVQSPLKNE